VVEDNSSVLHDDTPSDNNNNNNNTANINITTASGLNPAEDGARPMEEDPVTGRPQHDFQLSGTNEKNNFLNYVDTNQTRLDLSLEPRSIHQELVYHVEYLSSVQYHSAFLHHLGGWEEHGEYRNQARRRRHAQQQQPGAPVPPAPAPVAQSSRAVSTISVAFSNDSQTLASTHGDHTVKISCCVTGRLLQSLDGHPRTPWTVKYHPTNSDIVASGCLGHQVRVWNWREPSCLQMVRLEFAIISLTFHPSGKMLAIANGTRLHFWGVKQQQQRTGLSQANSAASAPPLTEMDQRHMLRCVHFPPNGKTLIIGGVNPTPAAASTPGGPPPPPRTRGGGVMSFYLRLWDFHLSIALNPVVYNAAGGASGTTITLRPISNPRTFVPRALLYNDGGFDVSPDGKMLCACVEYWLPEGVDNAMDLVHKEEEEGTDAKPERFSARSSTPPSKNNKTEATTTGRVISPVRNNNRPSTESPESHNNKKLRNNTNTSSSTTSAFDGRRSPPKHTTTNNSPAPTTPKLRRIPSASEPPPPPRPQHMQTHSGRPASSEAFTPRTPEPLSASESVPLSPPPPPGRRFVGGSNSDSNDQSGDNVGTGRATGGDNNTSSNAASAGSSQPPPLPPGASSAPNSSVPLNVRPPHPLSSVTSSSYPESYIRRGRYVPHVVTISLDTTPVALDRLPSALSPLSSASAPGTSRSKPYPAVAKGYRPRLGQIISACPLDAGKASAVTCVKFSPSTEFCLIGYGVRETSPSAALSNATAAVGSNAGGSNAGAIVAANNPHFHPVTAIYRLRGPGGMCQVSTMLSRDDDVNIARFHPDPGHGFVYGTKQGRVRVVSTRPWMFYNTNNIEAEGDDDEDMDM